MIAECLFILLVVLGLFSCLGMCMKCDTCEASARGSDEPSPVSIPEKPDLPRLERRVGRAVFELYRIKKLDPRVGACVDPDAKLDEWRSRLAWAKKIRDTSLKDLEDAKIVWADLSQKEE